MDASFLTLSAICLLLLVRNEIVYRIRLRALSAIFAREDWLQRSCRMDSPSYYAMVLDLTRWTFRSFYPDLAEGA